MRLARLPAIGKNSLIVYVRQGFSKGCGLSLSLALAGCAVSGDCQTIPLRTYSPAFSAHLADEVVAASPGAVWPDAVRGYAELRDAVKACRG